MEATLEAVGSGVFGPLGAPEHLEVVTGVGDTVDLVLGAVPTIGLYAC